MSGVTYEAICKDSWVENQLTPGFPLSAAAAETWKIFLSVHAKLINSWVSFLYSSHLSSPRTFSPYFIQLRLLWFIPLLLHSSSPLQHLQHSAKCSLVKSFHFFLISCCSVTSLSPYPSQNWHVAEQAWPDVEHISLDRKATYAIKTVRVKSKAKLGNDPTIMTSDWHLGNEYLHGLENFERTDVIGYACMQRLAKSNQASDRI